MAADPGATAEVELDMRETTGALKAEAAIPEWVIKRIERWADSLRASSRERLPDGHDNLGVTDEELGVSEQPTDRGNEEE